QALLRDVERATRETLSPLERLETTLHPWVSFVIMPLFAFANAGVPIQLGAFHDAVAIAVMVGLGIGKPLGIVLFCWLAVRSGLAKLSEGVSWEVLAAGGGLAGNWVFILRVLSGFVFNANLLYPSPICLF